jgi:hypothetical protein
MAVQQAAEGPSLTDQFFRTPGSFKARKSLPHPDLHPEQRKISGSTNGVLSARRTNGASMPGSFPVNGFDSILPPTPPRHAQDPSRTFTSRSSPPRQNGLHNASRRSLTHSSPVGARSPPTPDATPPTTASLDIPVRPALTALSPSSRADSFRTAREEQWSSEDEADGEHVYSHTSGAVKPVRQGSRDLGLGLDFERDDDSTPTPKKSKQASVRNGSGKFQLNGTDQFSAEAIPDREWDTNMMRNVTVRRKKRPLVSENQVGEDEQRVAAREILPKLFAGSSEDDDGPEPLTPSNDHFAQTMPGSQRPDERLKRLSGSSHTSTVLEAIIVPSSPRRRRTLRHVSKNLSLRSDDGSSRPSSNHASIASDDLSMSRLNDKLRIEHANRINGIYTPDPASVIPAIPLKHHPERMSLRLDSETFGDLVRRRASDGTQTTSPSSTRYRTFSGGESANVPNSTSNLMARELQPSTGEPVHVKYDSAAKHTLQRSEATGPQQHSLTRTATRRALQRLDATATADTRPNSFPRETPRLKPVTTSMIQVPSEDTDKPTEASLEPEPLSDVQAQKKDPVDQVSVEQPSTVDSIPRVSFDRSTITTQEMHRASNTSSNIRADSEHANARHLYAQTTPFSQTSEHEMGEATAVSLYPHNNNSLLVVQQVARPSGIQKQSDEVTSIPGWPTLTIQPATPPQHFGSPVNVDSPLKNPRRPPQPPQQSLMAPVINILPATPDTELDRISFTEKEVPRNTHPPARSLSLVQRARRYSDTMMRPIITRTSSLRRSYYRRSQYPRRGAPGQANRESTHSQATNLHPFWQPRGSWDEFSDSDSDWGEPEPGRSRLPAGGDTTELGEPHGIARVLDRARSTRGFLVGNSLGLERAGTNRNRPSLELPVGLRRRSSGRVVMKRSSQSPLHSIGSDTMRSARIAKRSMESLREMSGGEKKKSWNPRNWQVQYVGVSGMRNVWRQKQAEKRRRELKGKIGVRYSVENAPTRD